MQKYKKAISYKLLAFSFFTFLIPFEKCDLPQGTVEYFEKGIKNVLP